MSPRPHALPHDPPARAHRSPDTSHPALVTLHRSPDTSRIAPHASHLTPHPSRLKPHASSPTPHPSRHTPHAPPLTPHPSRPNPHAAQVNRDLEDPWLYDPNDLPLTTLQADLNLRLSTLGELSPSHESRCMYTPRRLLFIRRYPLCHGPRPTAHDHNAPASIRPSHADPKTRSRRWLAVKPPGGPTPLSAALSNPVFGVHKEAASAGTGADVDMVPALELGAVEPASASGDVLMTSQTNVMNGTHAANGV